MTDESREQKMAEIKARVEALRAAKAAEGKGTAASPTAAPPAASDTAPSTPQPEPPAAEGPAPSAPAGETAPKTPAAEGAELSREEKLAAIRARAEALRAARAGGTPAPAATAAGPAAPAAPAATKPAAPAAVEVPVSSLNPGGRPGTPPQAPTLQAFGTINQSVEILAEPVEAENLKKLLGGLGAYQNPLRGNAWQIDYRYYAQARRRLEAAGYTVTEKDYLDRPIATWNPVARGWTRVES